jgi:hypothetical protein
MSWHRFAILTATIALVAMPLPALAANASPMRAELAPEPSTALSACRARASTHLGEARTPLACGWGHPLSRT